MTNQLSSVTPAPSNLLLNLNLNRNLNPGTMVYDDMYNMEYRQSDTLHMPVLFEPLKQIRVSHAMFKATSFVEFGPYLRSFFSLERYI